MVDMDELIPLTTAEVDAFLHDLLMDAHGEEEQVTALDVRSTLQSVVAHEPWSEELFS